MLVDIQVNPAVTPWSQLRDLVSAAEDSGFGGAWVFDHLSGASLRGDGNLEAFTLLGALAATTSTISIGTMVVNLAIRPPALVATAAASAQEISGGRLLLGVGAGARPGSRFAAEHAAAGIELRSSMAERHQLVQQFVELTESMWVNDRERRWEGFPKADPPPPIIVGFRSNELGRLAARVADGVNVWAHRPDLGAALASVRAELTSRTRPGPFLVTVWDWWDIDWFDPWSPRRRALAAHDIDRLVLVTPAGLTTAEVGRAGARLGR